MLLFLVRHGECFGNVDAAQYADPDTALTPLGEIQATRVGERLAELNVTHLVSSPLMRALATTQIIADKTSIAHFEVWMDLREGNHGQYWCQPRCQLAAKAPKARLPEALGEADWLHETANYQVFTQRCERVITHLTATFTHADRVVVVTHGILASNLLHVLLGITWQRPTWFELANGSLTCVRLVADPAAERPGWALLPPVDIEVAYVNDTRHLSALSE